MSRAPISSTPAPTPDVPAPTPAPSFPPMPRVAGRLAIRVVYPPAGAMLSVRDSAFVFGSVGSGDASLRINGVRVKVHPNGSFLAFLAAPPPDDPVFRMVAARGADSVAVEH